MSATGGVTPGKGPILYQAHGNAINSDAKVGNNKGEPLTTKQKLKEIWNSFKSIFNKGETKTGTEMKTTHLWSITVYEDRSMHQEGEVPSEVFDRAMAFKSTPKSAKTSPPKPSPSTAETTTLKEPSSTSPANEDEALREAERLIREMTPQKRPRPTIPQVQTPFVSEWKAPVCHDVSELNNKINEFRNDKEKLKQLIDKNFDLINKQGPDILIAAVKNMNKAAINYLINEKHINPDTVEKSGQNIMLLARSVGGEAFVSWMTGVEGPIYTTQANRMLGQ